MHTGAGYENASVVEALLNGADGAWGGLPKGAAMIGHASIGELIANLVRLGNRPRRRSTDGLDQPTVSSPPNHPRAPDTHAPERPMNEASAKNAIDHTVYKTLLESTKAIPWKIEEELQRLRKELTELSFKDGLTGVGNRRMFDSILELEWSNARRNNQPLSVIMVDIDHFKQYNDRYGHVAGDDCLKRVGRRLNTAATRPRDFFARYGGEEFVVVLPESDQAAAALVAERCRDLVFKEQILHDASPVSQILTISVGVGTIIPSHGDEPLHFIAEVDRRLYRAKLNGRNRVVAGR